MARLPPSKGLKPPQRSTNISNVDRWHHRLGSLSLQWSRDQVMAAIVPHPWRGDLRLGPLHRLVAARLAHGGQVLQRGPETPHD